MFLMKNYRLLNKVQRWNHNTKFLLQNKSSRLLTNSKTVSLHTCVTNNCTPQLSFIKASSFRYCNRYSTISEKVRTNDISENPTDTNTDQKQNQNSWKFMKYGAILFGITFTVSGLVVIHNIGKPQYDIDGKEIEDEFSHLPYFHQIYKRLTKELTYYKKLVQEPSRDKLLPDPLEHPYIQPPYTLILELTDVLVHPDWTYQTGWRFKKRPGVDSFLEAVAPPQYETVVYTAEPGLTVFPILDKLDPHGYIMYRLVRDATRFVDGHHTKDLDAINRDLSKVIVIDWNSDNNKYHQENLLKIPRWDGNDNDTTLYDLAAFLKTIYGTNVEDVREVLRYYSQFDNPLEVFRENQRKLLIQLEEEDKSLKDGKNKLATKWRPSFFK